MKGFFPRRIAAASPPGSLLKHVSTRMHAEESAGRDADYLAQVRQLPCLKCGMEPSEAAHIRMASAAYGKSSGFGKKPHDAWALPLCSHCHRLARDAQHNRSDFEVWYAVGINPLLTAQKLYAKRGDHVAMYAVIFIAISERG